MTAYFQKECAKSFHEIKDYQALHALVDAAEAILNYAVLPELLERGNPKDAFGIRVEDLRRLRDAIRAVDAAR